MLSVQALMRISFGHAAEGFALRVIRAADQSKADDRDQRQNGADEIDVVIAAHLIVDKIEDGGSRGGQGAGHQHDPPKVGHKILTSIDIGHRGGIQVRHAAGSRGQPQDSNQNHDLVTVGGSQHGNAHDQVSYRQTHRGLVGAEFVINPAPQIAEGHANNRGGRHIIQRHRH